MAAPHPVGAPDPLQWSVAEARGIEALSATMAALPEPMSPELARSLQAQENWWRKIEAEHQMLSSTEVAARLGKKSDRAHVSRLRRAGRLLGYKRGAAYRHPGFQFDRTGVTVLLVVVDLLRVARGYGVPDGDLVMWLCTPSAYFEEQDEPVRHLHDRDAMLDAAEIRLDTRW